MGNVAVMEANLTKLQCCFAGGERALILTDASLVAASGGELAALHLDASSKVVPLPPTSILKPAMRRVRRRCSGQSLP